MIKSRCQQQEIKTCPSCLKEFVDDKMAGRPAMYCSKKCCQKAISLRKKHATK